MSLSVREEEGKRKRLSDPGAAGQAPARGGDQGSAPSAPRAVLSAPRSARIVPVSGHTLLNPG